MFSKIKSSLRNTLLLPETHPADLLAYEMIRKYENLGYMPYTNYSLRPYVVQQILNDITIRKPQVIIEFGSGWSTSIIANFILQENLNCKFYSFENQKAWHQMLLDKMPLAATDPRIHFQYAPLDKLENGFKGCKEWYDSKLVKLALAGVKQADLIIVDGPSDKAKSYIRYGFFLQIRELIHENTAIYIDDTNRKEEKEIAMDIKAILKLKSRPMGRALRLGNDVGL